MRISEQWLREWVATSACVDEIAEQLTMAGLEVDAVEPAAPALDGVLVGRIEQCAPHPEADRLWLCKVDIGDAEPLAIVCGAPNAHAGLVVPVATVGTILPGGVEVEATDIRGVASYGMLCSARELGLSHESEGLWALDRDAPIGSPLADYLGLPDQLLDIDLTPNRGDCLSVRGVARELAVAQDTSMAAPCFETPAQQSDIAREVYVDAADHCVGYAARSVVGTAAGAATPVWLQERLRRAGIRHINLPVDIGNYVMLELGQPMHAFDGDKLVGAIRVRMAVVGERITTLDGEPVALSEHTLVIADDEGPVAIAGMIGGLRTAVDADTTHVVFESACFIPQAVAGEGRRYKIHTDALHRFERGVDPALHPRALDRATGLLLEAGGGRAGPATRARGEPLWPETRRIALSAGNVARLLGQDITPAFIARALAALGVTLEARGEGQWLAVPPSWRFDLNIEADLIEEVARVYGYDRLQTRAQGVQLPPVRAQAPGADDNDGHAVLRQRGYSEAITYSFVEPGLHAALTDAARAVTLDNPISDQYVEMRRTLWASLLPAWQHNVRRQQTRVRLYESGLRFAPDDASEHGIAQVPSLAGLVAGMAEDTHWDREARAVDFFDIKGDVEALFASHAIPPVFEAARHPALHPGRSARILVDGKPAGWLGQISPELNKIYKNNILPYVFEIDSIFFQPTGTIRFESVSEQPLIRRDLAVAVSEATPVAALIAAIESVRAASLQSIEVFDIFRGKGLDKGFKSVALGLIFQDKASTLTDVGVDTTINSVIAALYAQCNARIRGEHSGIDESGPDRESV